MPRDDAVVGVGRHGDQRRIGAAALDVVIGRIGQQRLEVGLDVRMAIIVDPVAAGRELVETQHVHDANAGADRVEQVRALVGHRADQQAAVGAADGREAVRRRDAVGLQIFAGRNEVVEHILLVA